MLAASVHGWARFCGSIRKQTGFKRAEQAKAKYPVKGKKTMFSYPHLGVDSPSPPEEKNPARGSEPSTPKLTVETIDNHVYFYSHVDADRCLALIKTLREVDVRLRNEHLYRMLPDDHPPMPIWLHIQSPGGELFTALNVAAQIFRLKTPI